MGAGRTGRHTDTGSARGLRGRGSTLAPGTTASRCPESTLGPGEAGGVRREEVNSKLSTSV